MPKIEFYHHTGKGTVAVEVLEGHEMADFLTNWIRSPSDKKPKRLLKIGRARLAPGDQMNKKVGREVSVKNMTLKDFSLESLGVSHNGYVEVRLVCENIVVFFCFRSLEKRTFLKEVYVL